MSPDFEALSREIAATSDAWMVPGVEAVDSRGRIVRVIAPGFSPRARRVYPVGGLPPRSESEERVCDCRPDLTDAVTVNSLLGAGSVWQSLICNEFTARIADAATFSPDRTEAICRAWIAAHKGER